MPALDLNWLDSFVEQLPTREPAPTTLFDLLAVATRETTNSNLLAYYLDERNPHGLGRLFLDSLISCMSSAHSSISPEQCASAYTVERETNDIDILIRGEENSWAIILENKIFHILNNDLEKYWASVKNVSHDHKFGVVVSLKPLKTNHPKFVSVTHMAWLTNVKDAIAAGEAGAHSDSRHQFVFDDFFTTMMNNTAADSNNPENNQAIKLFQQHKANIDRLLAQQKSLQTYIQRHIDAVFGQYGFVEGPKRFYHPAKKELTDKSITPSVVELRFYVLDEIMDNNRLGIYLELYGEALKNGDIIRDKITSYLDGLGLRFDEHQNPSIYHLAVTINKAVLTADANLPAVLQQEIGKFFTPVANQPSLVAYCTGLLAAKPSTHE